MPSKIALLDAELLEANSFQETKPEGNTFRKQQLRQAKSQEIALRKLNDEHLWRQAFEETGAVQVTIGETEVAQTMKRHFEMLTDRHLSGELQVVGELWQMGASGAEVPV